jgi:hypothetical protein
MRYVLLALLCIFLAACRHSHPVPPVLQSFDTLRGQLQRISSLSAQVSVDVARTNRSMQQDDSSDARRLAGRLQRDAETLSAQSSRVGAKVLKIQESAHQAVERSYLGLVTRALANESSEGRSLIRVADVVQSDPLIMVPGDSGRLLRSETTARRLSNRAVVAVEAADKLRIQFKKSFRYVPVSVSR